MLTEICMILWCIWGSRNSRCLLLCRKDPGSIVTTALDLLSEFQSSKAALSVVPTAIVVPSIKGWCPPSQGCLKLNSDVAIRSHLLKAGLGVAVRDHQGQIVVTMAKS